MQLLQLVQRFFLTTVPTHQDNTVLHCIGAVEPYYRPQGLLDPQPRSQVGDWSNEFWMMLSTCTAPHVDSSFVPGSLLSSARNCMSLITTSPRQGNSQIKTELAAQHDMKDLILLVTLHSHVQTM